MAANFTLLAAAQAIRPAAPACLAKSVSGPLFVTEACTDPLLNKPYIDVRKQGSLTDASSGISATFLYVHGGFTGTKARFAFYFPAKGKYQGRFFQTSYPTIGEEDAAPGCPEIGTSACSVVFALANGAYAVSSNNAGGVPAGGPLAAYRANAAAAKYSREVAKEVYGTSERPRGYIYGASGGGYQTVGSLENTSGVWDGGVPMVFGVPNAIPSFMVAQLLALRVLRDKLPQIADAMAPGGSGDPYAGLTPEQQKTLREVSRLGAPLRGWWQYATMNGGGFYAVQGPVRAMDPTYVTDFWSKPGYAGSEPSVQAAKVIFETKVTGLGAENELTLAHIPVGDLVNADLVVVDGPKAGQLTTIRTISGDKVTVLSNAGITVGTTVRLDNSWLLALQYYPRHQVPTPREYGWDQYVQPDGTPLYPQRKAVIGPLLNAATAGSAADGHFKGKMIMVESVLDVMAYAWSADWYRQQAEASGGQSLLNDYRVWFMDNADHGPDLSGYDAGVGFAGVARASDHIVGYSGEVQQALLDLDVWVKKGTPPPASTSYHMDGDNQVQLAATASQRHGLQPVVALSVVSKGHDVPAKTIETVYGRSVTFTASAQTPPAAGKIVKVEWDFEGSGTFKEVERVPHIGESLSVQAKYTFNTPGTYFPVVRVTSNRKGDASTPFGLIQNLASVRVVVRGPSN